MQQGFFKTHFQKMVLVTSIILIVAVLLGWVGKIAYAKFLARKVITAVATEMKLESILYDGASFSLLKRTLTVHDLVLQPTDDRRTIKITRMDLKGYYGGNLDDNFQLYLFELIFPTNMTSTSWLGDMFHGIGYDGIAVNVDANCTITDDRVTLWPLVMDAKNAFWVKAYVDMESMRLSDYWMAQEHPVLLTLFLANATLVKGLLNYEDHGMMQKLLEKKAQLWSNTTQAVKLQLHQEAMTQIEKESDALKRKSLQALSDFVQHPTSIQLELRPDTQLSLASLVDAWSNGSMDSIVDSIDITYPIPGGETPLAK